MSCCRLDCSHSKLLQQTYKKSYSSGGKSNQDEAIKNYKENAAAIEKHNSDPTKTYKQGTNDAADLSQEERNKRNGMKPADKNVKASPLPKSVKGEIKAAVNYTR